MPKKRSRRPPRVYHDGLIPNTPDTHHNYPEVVPADHNQIKHEKSYPELAPPQPSTPPPEQPQRQYQHQHGHDSQHPPSTVITPPTSHGAQSYHQHHHTTSTTTNPSQIQLTGPPGIGSITNPPYLPALPRPSGVHSLRQAWSELGESRGNFDGGDGDGASFGGGERAPLWQRPIFWVVVMALVVIAALAGILGGVATGGIQTAWQSTGEGSGSSSGSGSQPPLPPPPVANPVCPGDNNRNYTNTATAQKTFRIQCDANYPGGDGALGLQSGPVDSIAACLDACALRADCVAAVFKPGDAAQCWLKQFIGIMESGGDAGGMVSGVLWQ